MIIISLENYFIGIDESNHGRFPEIYVAVLSKNSQDIIEDVKSKKRRNHDTIENILDGRDYRYLLVNEEDVDKLGSHAIKPIVISSLIYAFSIDLINTKVIIDGEGNHCLSKDTAHILSKRTDQLILPGRFTFASNADKLYPIVNKADEIAHVLFSYFRKFKLDKRLTKYENKMVYLDI